MWQFCGYSTNFHGYAPEVISYSVPEVAKCCIGLIPLGGGACFTGVATDSVKLGPWLDGLITSANLARQILGWQLYRTFARIGLRILSPLGRAVVEIGKRRAIEAALAADFGAGAATEAGMPLLMYTATGVLVTVAFVALLMFVFSVLVTHTFLPAKLAQQGAPTAASSLAKPTYVIEDDLHDLAKASGAQTPERKPPEFNRAPETRIVRPAQPFVAWKPDAKTILNPKSPLDLGKISGPNSTESTALSTASGRVATLDGSALKAERMRAATSGNMDQYNSLIEQHRALYKKHGIDPCIAGDFPEGCSQ